MEGETTKRSIEIGLLVVVPQGNVNIKEDWQTISVELPVTDREQTALVIGNYVLDRLQAKGLLPVEEEKQ